jgi:hypothetical protein
LFNKPINDVINISSRGEKKNRKTD